MATDKPFIMSVALAGCLIAWVLNVCGLHFAKWLSAAGSALTVATFLVMFFLLARAWAIHLPRAHDSLSLALPAFSLGTVGVFTKMALGGLSGFECSAVFSEECRAPENDLRRSVLIAAPLIAAMYMIGTSSLLAYIAPADIDLAAPVGQVMQAGFGGKGLGQVLATATVCGFNIGLLAALVVVVGMVARLPMVAGWDGLLPGWWSTLHPRFGTPTKAIAAVTFAILLLSALSLIDNGNQEAVEATLAAGLGACCLEYMLMFGAVAFGFRSQARDDAIRIHWGIRLAAFSAFLVSFVALIFELLAPGEVANPKVFAFKVGGTIFATTLLGAILYWRGARRLPRGPVKT
jgi:amino acid transporter